MSFPAYSALFKLTLRQLFWSKRGLLILLGCILPLVIAIIVRFNVNRASSVNTFIPYITFYLYGFLTNICAIFYGSAIVSDEVDGRGLTYLQMRPLKKPLILLTKFAAYMIGTIAFITISHLLLTGIMETHLKFRDHLLVLGMSFVYSGSLSLGLLAYGALAVLISARFKYPVLWLLLFVFGWEMISAIPQMPIGIKRLAYKHYLMTLFPEFNLGRDLLENLLGESPPAIWVAAIVVCLLTVGTMWLAIRVFKEREYLM